jgi:hypothetical protein
MLVCLGCAGPSFTSREVRTEPTWFVHLETFVEAGKAAAVRYDHPADWAVSDIHAIVSRLLLQERVGLFDTKPAPRAVFSPDEASRLAPALAEAFRQARPMEWVAFYIERPGGVPASTRGGVRQEVTSGGMFLQDRRLHVIVANHREGMMPGPEGTDAIRANPIRSLRGTGGALTFDPQTVVLASQANWLGGSSGPSASEVVLDHAAFLAAMPAGGFGAMSPAAESELSALKTQVRKLEEEVARLKQRLEAQAEDLARLRSRQPASGPSRPAPSTPSGR